MSKALRYLVRAGSTRPRRSAISKESLCGLPDRLAYQVIRTVHQKRLKTLALWHLYDPFETFFFAPRGSANASLRAVHGSRALKQEY